MFISASEPTTPHILYGNDKALQVSDPFKKKLEKTEVVEKADMLHVISPIAGYDQEGREVKLGFLISGFSLESMKEVIRKTNYIIVMLCVAFIVLGIISGVIQSRFLVTPLKKTMGLIDTIAQGDFARGLEYSSQDELGELMLTLNTMITTWKHSIEKIKDAIDLSNSASREISIVAHQQEKITSKEASSVSEITTTVEELNTSSEQISGEAEKIVQASRDVLKIVSDGQHYVSEGIGEFNDIRERVNAIAEHVLTLRLEAQQIGGIVKEVSSIANKTDMLAINAGIEAARAGEQGKGFSVVASEIRDFADQRQKSADKISSLI